MPNLFNYYDQGPLQVYCTLELVLVIDDLVVLASDQ